MSVPTLSGMKLTKLSWILPVQDIISNLAVGLQILCFQSSLSFKSITYMDPCFVSEFVTTYLGHIFLKIDSGTVGERNVLCAPRRSNIHPEPFSSCRVNLITWFLFYLNFFLQGQTCTFISNTGANSVPKCWPEFWCGELELGINYLRLFHVGTVLPTTVAPQCRLGADSIPARLGSGVGSIKTRLNSNLCLCVLGMKIEAGVSPPMQADSLAKSSRDCGWLNRLVAPPSAVWSLI